MSQLTEKSETLSLESLLVVVDSKSRVVDNEARQEELRRLWPGEGEVRAVVLVVLVMVMDQRKMEEHKEKQILLLVH